MAQTVYISLIKLAAIEQFSDASIAMYCLEPSTKQLTRPRNAVVVGVEVIVVVLVDVTVLVAVDVSVEEGVLDREVVGVVDTLVVGVVISQDANVLSTTEPTIEFNVAQASGSIVVKWSFVVRSPPEQTIAEKVGLCVYSRIAAVRTCPSVEEHSIV